MTPTWQSQLPPRTRSQWGTNNKNTLAVDQDISRKIQRSLRNVAHSLYQSLSLVVLEIGNQLLSAVVSDELHIPFYVPLLDRTSPISSPSDGWRVLFGFPFSGLELEAILRPGGVLG